MSAEHTSVLLGTVPAFNMFMSAWEQLGKKHPHLAQWTDISVKWATTYYTKMDDTHTYIIAMCESNFRFIYHLIT
jgi:hypothetical protein